MKERVIGNEIIEEKLEQNKNQEQIQTQDPLLQQCNKFHDINMDILQQKHPHIYKRVKEYEEGKYQSKVSDLYDEIYLAHQDDNPTIIQNVVIEKNGQKYLVCDHNNPLAQSQQWLDNRVDPSNKVELLFGCGLSYHIELLLEKYPEKKILLIEPSVELFIYLISARDMTKVFERIWILLEEDFDVFLKNFLVLYWDARNKGIFKLQAINVYSTVFQPVWDEFREKLKKQVNALMVDTATRKILTEKWLRNYTVNVKKLKEAANADGFLGKFKDVPGILVSAGPCLEKNIHLLKDIKDKCLLLSASSARLSMKQYNVSPHLFMTVDASEGETRLVDGVDDDNEYMIYSNQLAPKSLEIFRGKKIFINYNSDFYTTNFLHWAGIKSGFIMSAPSVSNTCFDFLYRLGCNPIIFIGQDLAFTKNKQYAGKIDYGLDMEEEGFKQAGYPLVEDIYGYPVYTMPSFLAMKNCFEDQIRRAKMEQPELEVINCTEGGLGIDGARNEKLEDIIKMFEHHQISDLIEELHRTYMFDDFTDKVLEFNRYLIKELDGLKDLTIKQNEMLDKVAKFKTVNLSKKKKEAFNKLIKEADLMSKTREESMIYRLLISPLVQVDLFTMGIKFVKENEHEKNFEKKRKVYVDTLKGQIKMIDEKIEMVKGFLDEKEPLVSEEKIQEKSEDAK